MMSNNETSEIPVHDFTVNKENETLFEIFIYSPLTVITPILDANFLPHRHMFYELIFLTGGRGKHIIDFEVYECNPPMLYFLSPGQIHFWELTEKMEGYVFLFKEDFLLTSKLGAGGHDEFTFFHSMQETPHIYLDHQNSSHLQTLVDPMIAETKHNDEFQESVLQAYFHIFLMNVQRLCSDNSETQDKVSLVRRFRKFITTHRNSSLDVQGCADALGVSVTHLRNSVKEKTGKSPGFILRQEIVLEAKRLLIHSELTAAEIGYNLGFEDPSYFGRFFKRESGLSPSAFRQRIIEKYQLKVV